MKEEYKKIQNPEELLDFMNKNINYGYLSKNDKIYHQDDPNFDKDWYNNYILESTEDILNTKVGNCFDQVEFEREWFLKHNYEIKVFFHIINLSYDNPYPTHTFLTYKYNNKFYWFENAWNELKGIHEFDTMEELLNFEYEENVKNLKRFNIKDEELKCFKINEIKIPKKHITAKEYLNFCLKN